MIVKALALVCIVHAVGEHSCPTIVFEDEFSSVKECTWLIRRDFIICRITKRLFWMIAS